MRVLLRVPATGRDIIATGTDEHLHLLAHLQAVRNGGIWKTRMECVVLLGKFATDVGEKLSNNQNQNS